MRVKNGRVDKPIVTRPLVSLDYFVVAEVAGGS